MIFFQNVNSLFLSNFLFLYTKYFHNTNQISLFSFCPCYKHTQHRLVKHDKKIFIKRCSFILLRCVLILVTREEGSPLFLHCPSRCCRLPSVFSKLNKMNYQGIPWIGEEWTQTKEPGTHCMLCFQC